MLDSQTRTCKYTKNYISFVERVYAPQVQNKDVKPIYLYLRKVDKHGEIECTFIKNMRAMQTILSTDNKTAVTTSKVLHYCHKCLSGFITQHSYNDHMLYCAGLNVEAHLFKKEGHFKFDKHSCVDAPPFMMFFDVETRLVHESKSLSTMVLVSYAIGVVFNDGIDLPMFSLYRSSHQTYRELRTFNIPSIIKQAILHDDKKKCRQLAASIVGKKPYAINEKLFNDIFSIACRNVLYEFYLPKNRDLSFSAQNRFMKSVNSGDKCVLCDIPVDLCLTESLDRNRAVLEAQSYEIYRLVCERRTSRGVYEKLNEKDFISKLLLVNIYYEAYTQLDRTLQYESIDGCEPDLECGWDPIRAAKRLDLELDVMEAVQSLFAKVVEPSGNFAEQADEFSDMYDEYLDNTVKKKSDDLGAPDRTLYMRMFITMYIMSDVGDYTDIAASDYTTLQNAYDDGSAVHHDHFSGMYLFSKSLVCCVV